MRFEVRTREIVARTANDEAVKRATYHKVRRKVRVRNRLRFRFKDITDAPDRVDERASERTIYLVP
jgi:hypothetical protein